MKDYKINVYAISAATSKQIQKHAFKLGYTQMDGSVDIDPDIGPYLYLLGNKMVSGSNAFVYFAEEISYTDFLALPIPAKEVAGPKLEDLSIADLSVLEKEFENYLSRDMEKFFHEVRRVRRDKVGEIYQSTLKRLDKE